MGYSRQQWQGLSVIVGRRRGTATRGARVDNEAEAAYAGQGIAGGGADMARKKRMTAKQWQTCTNPTVMLRFLHDRMSERKRRLFTCACCRRIWNLLADKRFRHTV